MLLIFSVGLILSRTEAIAEQCFTLVSSATRRDSIRVVPAKTQLHCNIQCVYTPGCDACMFYENRSSCILLSPARAPPPGSCPATYTCYQKQQSGCPVRSPALVNRGYTPGQCSRPSDVLGRPVTGAMPVCGDPGVGQRRIALDAILHDGTHQVLDNHKFAFVNFDPYMGSWYHSMPGSLTYFKSATCARPPATPLPGCACKPLQTEQRIPPPWSLDTIRGPIMGTAPVCPGRVQVQFKRFVGGSGETVEFPDSPGRAIYCAMGEWMCIIETPGNYNEFAVVAATCVV